jgi:hypothetical protein
MIISRQGDIIPIQHMIVSMHGDIITIQHMIISRHGDIITIQHMIISRHGTHNYNSGCSILDQIFCEGVISLFDLEYSVKMGEGW